MKQLFAILIAIGVALTAGARTVKKATPEVRSKFTKNLTALIATSKRPSGFDSLKQLELSRGVWNCKLELDGFLPTVEEPPINPTGKLVVSAISVAPSARGNVKMLLLKGLPGYTMQDSDNDKSISLDRTKYTRKVVFTKKERTVESVVTVLFVAHKYESVKIIIEAWQ